MNDRTAEKYFILSTALEVDERAVHVDVMRQDSEYGTEAYYWILSFEHEGQKISAESFDYATAVTELFEAAEKLGVLNGDFIIG